MRNSPSTESNVFHGPVYKVFDNVYPLAKNNETLHSILNKQK